MHRHPGGKLPLPHQYYLSGHQHPQLVIDLHAAAVMQTTDLFSPVHRHASGSLRPTQGCLGHKNVVSPEASWATVPTSW